MKRPRREAEEGALRGGPPEGPPRSREEVPCLDLGPLVPEVAAALAASRGVPLERLGPESFPLGPRLGACAREAARELAGGCGAVLLRFPAAWADELGEGDCQRAFLGLCSHLGRPVTQSVDLGEVCARVEVARAPEVLAARHTKRRGYRNAQEQRLHVDSSIPAARGAGVCDVLAMLCVRPARGGGVSKLASAEDIHALLRRDRPELLAALRRGFRYDAAKVEYHPDWRQPPTGEEERPLVFHDGRGRACVQYAKNMEETIGAAYAGTPREAEVAASLEALGEVCSDPAVVQHWELGAGEAYLIDNYRWLHARTAFEDDPALPRLFFRLWLQVDDFDAVP